LFILHRILFVSFLFNHIAHTDIYTLSLHDALPILSVGLAALISFPLFFIKKLQVNRYKFLELCNYYQSVVQTKSWLSQRSMNLRSEEHTSELQSRENLVCRLLLEKKKS